MSCSRGREMTSMSHATAPETRELLSPGLSVVIPVYQSETILPELVSRLDRVLHRLAPEFEVILVNDCSPDRSWEVMCRLAKEHAWIRPIDLMRNYGQHNALLCGIRAVRYEWVVTMDDDLQHPPEEIPRLLDYVRETKCDVVYGTPAQPPYGLLRNLATLATKTALRNVMGTKIAQEVCAFRIFRAELAAAFRQYEGPFVSIDVLLTWGTNRFGALRVHHERRQHGKSAYTFRKLIIHTMNMMTGFSTLPLQLASLIGFALTLFGVVVLGYVLLRYATYDDSVPGFPFLASIIALFSGAQLFALGIIGEYLARMHFRSMQKPPYVIRAHPAGGDGVQENLSDDRKL
jgi:glycosyltransferase involved in cell wall biosynthesis